MKRQQITKFIGSVCFCLRVSLVAWAVIDRQAPSAEDVTKNDPSSGEYKLIWAEEFDREGRLGLINHVPLLVRAEVEDLRGEAI